VIICSALYYTGSLANGDLIVRDNRWYPGKYVDTFPVWWSYVRKHYPQEQVILFCDTASPIPLQPMLETLGEPYEVFTVRPDMIAPARVHVKWLSEHSGKYFWPMQRNLVEGLVTAYQMNEDLLWIDNDCFLNTNVKPLVQGSDVASSNVEHHQQTLGSVCFYISKRRLHALDDLGIDLPGYLYNMLNLGPTNTRMHALQEGGLYKTFGYGDLRQISHINMSHLSCYPRFMRFLRANPLDTPEYRDLVARLETFDFTRLAGVDISFLDMLHSEMEGCIPWVK
jgi:hypothetical protein